jgi:hypothetical protein
MLRRIHVAKVCESQSAAFSAVQGDAGSSALAIRLIRAITIPVSASPTGLSFGIVPP